MTMNSTMLRSFACFLLLGCTLSARAATLVDDTFLDANRTDPVTYSEMGVDTDLDLNVESRWFGSTLSATASHLTGTVGTGSASWTTYFTDTFANSINLGGIGQKMIITWVFTPTTVNAGNASQGFRMAIAQSTSGGRLAADGTPASQAFTGYAIFQNMAPTLARANNDNLDIMERTNLVSSDLLSTGSNWQKAAGGGTQTTEGFVSGTQYTFVFSAERTGSGLQLDASFTGGNIDGDGSLTASFLDTTPNSYSFDTFALRPSSSTSAAASFDTTLFRVEYVPEPSVMILVLGGAGLMCLVHRLRQRN